MCRALVVTLILGLGNLGASGAAAAAELRPLSEVMDVSNPSGQIYILQRCAGAALAFASRLVNSGRQDVDELINRSTTRASADMMAAAEIARQAGLNQDLPYIMRQAQATAVLYNRDMSDSYLRTGDAISGYVLDDMTFCASLR